ncbi:MAG: hypothetical protein HWD82_10845 [Flavobacteriaceae bacterium]|nr:hypothetical protein [Flavobacteriaceae bacterium]
MKNLKSLLFVSFLFIAFSVQAQKKLEKKAEKITSEITKVLNLTDEESKIIYQIQLERFLQAKKIRSQYTNNEALRKEELKKHGNQVYNKMKNALGKERLKKWSKYKSTKNK